MTIVREERENNHRELVMVGLVCDRCGNETKPLVGVIRSWPFRGSYVRGCLYPTSNLADSIEVEKELCGPCTEELLEWIGP